MCRTSIALLCAFLTWGCSKPEPGSEQSKTAGEATIDTCYPLLERLSPYRHQSLHPQFKQKIGTDSSQSMSYEMAMRIGGGNRTPITPMSEIEFKGFVDREMEIFKGESVRYTRYGDHSTRVVIARIIRAKFGLARSDGDVRIADSFLAQIFQNGESCGVWSVERK